MSHVLTFVVSRPWSRIYNRVVDTLHGTLGVMRALRQVSARNVASGRIVGKADARSLKRLVWMLGGEVRSLSRTPSIAAYFSLKLAV